MTLLHRFFFSHLEVLQLCHSTSSLRSINVSVHYFRYLHPIYTMRKRVEFNSVLPLTKASIIFIHLKVEQITSLAHTLYQWQVFNA